jgi:hypothetical protein
MQTDRGAAIHLDLPFYRQHWNYTCGPASLMMAMKHLDDRVRPDRDLEIDIWREATFVAARGTSRYGLAYAAAVRGFSARATSSTGGIDFQERLVSILDTSEMQLLRDQFAERRARCSRLGVRDRQGAITGDSLRRSLERDRVPLIVTSALFYCDDDLPHWVAVTGMDDAFLYFNNPDDAWPRRRRIALAELERFVGYHGDQSMVEVWTG